jgi:Right handed beta helix region
MQSFRVIVLSALTGIAVAVPATSGGAATVVSAPASIPSDCSRDVTAALVSWIASVPDGSTLQFAPQGCYRVDGTLTIKNRNALTLDGRGATFRAFTSGRELPPTQARTRSTFNFWRGANITVRNTIVRGANPNAGTGDLAYVAALEAQSAYVIGGVQNMVLDHVEAYDVYGDFVFVGAATKNLLVENSTFARNGRQGWTINGQDIVFDHNTIRQTRRATIDLEPSAVSSITRRVTISNNTIGIGRLYFFANEGRAAPTEDISILNNTFVNKAMTIRVAPPSGIRSRYRVIGNVSDTPVGFGGGGAFAFHNVVDIEVRDNVQPMQRGRGISGVLIKNCRNVAVTGNRFPYGKGPVTSLGGNMNVSQSANLVGNPLRAVAPTSVAGPS